MKKSIVICIAIGLFCLFFVYVFNNTFPRSYHHLFTKTTDLGKENVEGLVLHDSFYKKELVQKYEDIEHSRDVEHYNYYQLRKGIEIATNHSNKITRFIITDDSLQTAKGIRIGQKKEDIIQAYGNHYYSRSEQGVNIIGYVDKKRESSIEFWLINDTVEFYRLDIKSME